MALSFTLSPVNILIEPDVTAQPMTSAFTTT